MTSRPANKPASAKSGGLQPHNAPQNCSRCQDRRTVASGEPVARLVVCPGCHGIGPVAKAAPPDADQRIPYGTNDAAWARIPEFLRGGLLRYIEHRIPPGGFLRAFLEGDIVLARAHALPESEAALGDLAYWVYCYAPRESFGGIDLVAAWLSQPIQPTGTENNE